MSTKLNAEELAFEAAGQTDRYVAWRKGYAQAIREHSQRIADERDEAINRAEIAEAHAVIFAQKLAAMTDERDELREVLKEIIGSMDRGYMVHQLSVDKASAILAKYPKP